MNVKKAILIGLIIILSSGLRAQEKLSLSLDEARQYALQYNRSLKSSGLSLQQAQAAVWQTIAKGLPQVQVAGSYQNTLGAKATINFPGMPPQSFSLGNSGSIQPQISQLLFSGSYWVGIQLAKLSQQLSETMVKKTEQDVIQQVSSSYYTVLLVENVDHTLKQNRDNLLDIIHKTEATVKVGMGTQTDVDQLSVQYALVDNQVKSNERQIEMAYNMLRLLLGVNEKTIIELKDSLESFINPVQAATLLDEPFDMSKNYTYILSKQQLDISQQQVRLQKASWLPTLSAFYYHTFYYIQPPTQFSPNDIFGVQLNWPIFSSGGTLSAIKQAKLKVKSSENDMAALQEQLAIQYQQAKFNLNNAIDKLDAQIKNLEVSQRVYDNIVQKHEQGVASAMEVTTTSNNLLQAQSNYTAALVDMLNAKISLEILLNKY